MSNIGTNILIGIAVGDALGVPFEFSEREEMIKYPAKDMVGYETHNQLPGTWSDDSSLTFCLAESLANNYDLATVALNFVKWKNEAYWTARNNVFDIGMTTSKAISRLEKILLNKELNDLKLLKNDAEEFDNGNGSLMRILPLILEIKGLENKNQFEVVWDNSALTHRHIRAAMSCFIYLKLSEFIIQGETKLEAYHKTRREVMDLWEQINFPESEKQHFKRVIQTSIVDYPKDSIMSGGYVIESLEASFWSFLKTESFEDAVLTAINFGHDTDTTGAITGGLAGIYYKIDKIPDYWIASLARMEDIFKLGEKLDNKYNK